MKRKSPRQYAEILYEATLDASGKTIDSVVKAFVELLAHDHVITQAGYIMDAFMQLTKEKIGVKELSITSARELSQKELERIARAFGASVEVQTDVDQTLIGGVKIRTGNTILDGSIRTQLNTLQEALQ